MLVRCLFCVSLSDGGPFFCLQLKFQFSHVVSNMTLAVVVIDWHMALSSMKECVFLESVGKTFRKLSESGLLLPLL